MRAVIATADQLAAVRPVRVGIDVTVMTTGRLTTRRRKLRTALVCLDTCLVVAVAQGRDGASAARLMAEPAPNATVVACNLFSGFKTAAATLDDAVVVADVFYLVRLALQALGEVRRRRQQQIHGHRGTRATRCTSSVASCGSARNASPLRPSPRSTAGPERRTPTTRSVLPGARLTCSAVSTPPTIATPPTDAW